MDFLTRILLLISKKLVRSQTKEKTIKNNKTSETEVDYKKII